MNIPALSRHVPERVLLEIPEVVDCFEINTPLRMAHFLGQCSHESGGFRQVFENLNYRPETLLKLFPRRVKDPYMAQHIASSPRLIANTIYYKIGGNEFHEDGWKFRGRGYIQLTGKFNYSEFDKFVPENIVENPDLVATKYPLLSAAWYWMFRKINSRIEDVSDETIMRVTKIVNGGSHGLADRIRLTKTFYDLLHDA